MLPTHSLLAQLRSDLKNFGLNPLDWFILNFKNGRVVLRHREDSDFTMEGFVGREAQQASLVSLRLLSI